MSHIVEFSGMLNKDNIPYLGQAQLMYAYFEIRPGMSAANVRMPLNFSLVLDKSGSMAGAKIRQLREAVISLIEQLQWDDTVSIIAFNSSVDRLISATSVDDKNKLGKQIGKLKAGGGTNLAPAMAAGLSEIRKFIGPDKTSRLILLTDGQTVAESKCHERADEAGQMKVPIIALGLGTSWNENLLIDLAQRSGAVGYADLIKRPEDVDNIFQEVLSQMKVVAQDLSFRLLMVQGVEARRIWQVTPLIKDVSMGAIMGRTVSVDLPELSESGAAFLIEMLIPSRNPGTYRFAQGEVSYSAPLQGLINQKERIDVTATVTTDQFMAQQVNGRVMNIVEKVTAFKLQTQALDEAAMGNVAGATRKLRAAHTILLDQGEVELAQIAQNEAERLEKGQGVSSEGSKTIKLQSRKTVKLSDKNLP